MFFSSFRSDGSKQEVAPEKPHSRIYSESELAMSRQTAPSFEIKDSMSTNSSCNNVPSTPASIISETPIFEHRLKKRAKKRQAKRGAFSTQRQTSEPDTLERKHLDTGCPRCRKNVSKRLAIDECRLCDVGIKAVFRGIRRICNEQQMLLQGRVPEHEIHQHLEAFC